MASAQLLQLTAFLLTAGVTLTSSGEKSPLCNMASHQNTLTTSYYYYNTQTV